MRTIMRRDVCIVGGTAGVRTIMRRDVCVVGGTAG